MKKKTILAFNLVAFIIIICLFTVKWEIPFFVDYYRDDQFNKIDIQIQIDDKIIYNDTLTYTDLPVNKSFDYKLRIGYHKIHLSSKMMGLERKEEVFIFFNQYVSILCIGRNKYSQKRDFDIWIGNNPAKFE